MGNIFPCVMYDRVQVISVPTACLLSAGANEIVFPSKETFSLLMDPVHVTIPDP